ncbi:hypothetical protein AVEN_137312-1 [Araneus ventricosus]|uniref:Uncharacterized protein n=1 Tax=Araneus ventricosus TaxID=182803 RepID=A0A4Y2FK33_ARAVE|nr:hypothetical protein AVEN_137312-1 [Araneus ventricosus]
MTVNLSLYNELPIGLRWPSGKFSTSEIKKFQALSPLPLKIRRIRFCQVFALVHIKSYVGGQTSYSWYGVEDWRGVPAQVSSSSSDRGSK